MYSFYLFEFRQFCSNWVQNSIEFQYHASVVVQGLMARFVLGKDRFPVTY